MNMPSIHLPCNTQSKNQKQQMCCYSSCHTTLSEKRNGIQFKEAFQGLSKIGCQPKSTSRGLGFSFQSAITVRRLSLIRHSNAPSARTTSLQLSWIRMNALSFFIMGFSALEFFVYMNSSQISVLLDALVHFLLATTVYCILCERKKCLIFRLCLLFYAVFKTVISMEDENENQKWLKFWVFYGLLSCICSYCPHGSFIKACTCGILLLKFNVHLEFGCYCRIISSYILYMM